MFGWTMGSSKSLHSVANTSTFNDKSSMPPPRKILRRGSAEWKDAIVKGDIEESLPETGFGGWITQDLAKIPQNTASPPPLVQEELTDMILSTDIHKDTGQRTRDESNGSTMARQEGSEENISVRPHQAGSDQDTSGHNPLNNAAPYPHQTESEGAFQTGMAPVGQDDTSNLITSRFCDIIGHGAAKLRLDEILLPLALPPDLTEGILTGIRSLSASVLLFGPPGCGKTQLATAIAGEAQAALLQVGPSDVLSKYVGESEASLRSLFDKAFTKARNMESKTAVLFFDEIDAIGQSRGHPSVSPSASLGGGGDVCSRRVLAELLIQLNRLNSRGRPSDGVQDMGSTGLGRNASSPTAAVAVDVGNDVSLQQQVENQNESPQVRVIVVAATNRPEDCDPALIRRFSVRVFVGPPSHRDRKRLLFRFLDGIEHSISRKELDEIAVATNGWSGSDLESLAREAAMAPVRECIRSAALLKRRMAFGQRNCRGSRYLAPTQITNPKQEAKNNLLHQFRCLRKVSTQDFRDAIAFCSGGGAGANSPASIQQPENNTSHYDSSSSSSDDDDEDYSTASKTDYFRL